jgi:hypothetical protein
MGREMKKIDRRTGLCDGVDCCVVMGSIFNGWVSLVQMLTLILFWK